MILLQKAAEFAKVDDLIAAANTECVEGIIESRSECHSERVLRKELRKWKIDSVVIMQPGDRFAIKVVSSNGCYVQVCLKQLFLC